MKWSLTQTLWTYWDEPWFFGTFTQPWWLCWIVNGDHWGKHQKSSGHSWLQPPDARFAGPRGEPSRTFSGKSDCSSGAGGGVWWWLALIVFSGTSCLGQLFDALIHLCGTDSRENSSLSQYFWGNSPLYFCLEPTIINETPCLILLSWANSCRSNFFCEATLLRAASSLAWNFLKHFAELLLILALSSQRYLFCEAPPLLAILDYTSLRYLFLELPLLSAIHSLRLWATSSLSQSLFWAQSSFFGGFWANSGATLGNSFFPASYSKSRLRRSLFNNMFLQNRALLAATRTFFEQLFPTQARNRETLRPLEPQNLQKHILPCISTVVIPLTIGFHLCCMSTSELVMFSVWWLKY